MSELSRIREAVGRVPSGLFILSSGTGGDASGALVSWVQQAGFEPLAVTVAVRADRDIGAVIERTGGFCLSVLAEGDRDLLARFAKGAASGEEPLLGIEHSFSSVGGARPAPARIWMGCRLLGHQRWSDHVIYCGEVLEGRADEGARPMIHVRKDGSRY
ncbi:MAG: hypothetical protein Fur0037_28270 [Planctomycetota bacterium]